MTGFRHILFPVDLSERCGAIRPFVTHIATRFGAKLTLLHVFEKSTGEWLAATENTAAVAFADDQMHEESCSLLSEFFPRQADTQFEIAHRARCGDPGEQIVAFAKQQGVDLLMMPTHSHGKFRRLLLGSVTSEVLEGAPCPVWTAAHTEDPAMVHHANCRTILAAGSPKAAELGSTLAAGARVEILNVAQCHNVAKVARERNADLLVLGMPRSEANDVIREVSCPVLTL
jgi:nucleotide-binding universal stress UspA family protein